MWSRSISASAAVLSAATTVVYLPLYPVDGPPFAVRTLEDFLGWVDPETGSTVPEGQGVRRFARLS